MNRLLRSKKGFTLLELIVVISIIGMVITTVFSIVFFGYDVYGMTTDDYTIQSDVRLAMEEVNATIRDSKALFAVPGITYMDDQWNYIGLNDDETMIIDYRWDPGAGADGDHVERVLVGPYEGVTFNILFDKENSMSQDNTLRMYFEAYTNNGSTKRFDILSGYEALNSLQVVNYGTVDNPATALAYRADEFHYENMKILVNIALVLDTSGSMEYGLDGRTTSTLNNRRIKILKDQTNMLVEQFAANTNPDVEIQMALVEFNNDANDIQDFRNVKTQKAQLIADVNSMCQGSLQDCNGATNTGDGLRRAYHALEDIKAEQILLHSGPSQEVVVKNYTIILSDGVYTYFTEYISNIETVEEEVCGFYFWGSCWWWQTSVQQTVTRDFYLGDGDVNGSRNSVGITLNSPYYDGLGNNEDPNGLAYIQAVSDLGLNDNLEYTNYIIAFGYNDPSSGTVIEKIRNATNTDPTRVFTADNADELGLTFTNIQMSITNDTWHYLGPKLIGD